LLLAEAEHVPVLPTPDAKLASAPPLRFDLVDAFRYQERAMNLSRLKVMTLIFVSVLASSIATAEARGQWMTFTNCRYLPNPANDGDSFHVRTGGREYIFRLYFVDSPETDASLPERVAEQAKYFGVSAPQTLQIGLEAERFTRQELARPFTVRTCKQDARGRSRLKRYFAFIQTDRADLGEQLVANGLARVYGAASEAPDMNTPEVEWRKLEQFERKAKQEKIGGWGIGAGRLNTRATTQPTTSSDYFEAFFHPKTAPLAATPLSERSVSGAKFNINTATCEQLQDIPGIGNVLAERIIASRPFKSADELGKVKGIGKVKYQQLRPYFE
jgi:competence ComEA-like helix-hairpin-helix protein